MSIEMENGFQIVWLKRDLRLEDHCALFEARKRGPVLALYVIEPEYWRLPDTSARQWQFIAESLDALQPRLARLGIPLIYFEGSVVRALASLWEAGLLSALYSHQETGNHWTFQRDLKVKAWTTAHSIPWHESMQHGVFRVLDTRNGWAKRWDAMMLEPGPPLPSRQRWPSEAIGALPENFTLERATFEIAPDDCPGRQRGGREEGLSLLASFLAGRGEHYRRAMSSPLEGADACSRLSPHLAYGTLSMREVFQAAVERLRQLDKENPAHKAMRQSLISFIGRLHWHCHFIQKLETTPAIEWMEQHSAYRGMRPEEPDDEILERWFVGQTGWPFLDACMRSLRETGWLNFRMRAMVMAIASYHLWQPWQESGKLLARLFTDYEPGIHWPQSQMQSGVTGINTVRIYNPIKQGYDQDPDGIFIKRWVPELRDLDGKALHEPWLLDASVVNYPAPITDAKAAAAKARDAVWKVRRQKGFREEAAGVLEKHSSRKSLKQPDHNFKRRTKRAPDPDQLKLDL